MNSTPVGFCLFCVVVSGGDQFTKLQFDTHHDVIFSTDAASMIIVVVILQDAT